MYAISYDDTEALSAYVDATGVGLTLLSDIDSEIIRRYDVLNTIITPEDIPHYGVPFPGFFLLDEDGVIVDKIFNRHLAHRDGVERILDSFAGRIAVEGREPDDMVTEDDGITIGAFMRGGAGVLRVGPMRRVVVRFEMPEGLHIYDEPVPEGMVAAGVEITGPDGLRFDSVESPATRPLSLPGITEPLQVWDGTVDFVVPFFANSGMAGALLSGDGSITLEVAVRYQACDDTRCFLPRTHTITLDVPIEFGVIPGFGKLRGLLPTVIDMDSTAHMKRLFLRKAAESEST